MKKRLIAASIVILLLMLFIFSSCNSQNPGQEGFAIYLTRDDVPVSQMEALSHVEIADTPIISMNDLEIYYANNHEIKLAHGAHKRVTALQVPTSGKSFVVCVDKKPIYWGAFWTPVSSQSFDGVVIMIPPFPAEEIPADSIRIELGYPSENFFSGEDPRANRAILESLLRESLD